MSVEVERLIATLEARVDKFEKALVKSYQKSDENFGKIERRGRQMTERLEGAMAAAGQKAIGFGASLAKGFLGGLAAGGIAGVVAGIGQVANSVAAVGDEARRAGVDVEAFQELRYVAEQNRIGVDALTDGLKELNLRADEFIVTGKGSAAEAFQRLGYDADTLKKKLADPSALFSEIIGKLGQLDQAAQIRIADEIFGGTGGERFVQLVEQGEDGIRATVQQARDLGVVMSSDVIARAEELDRKFNEISNTVGAALKGAIVEAATALSDFIASFNAWGSEIRDTPAGQGQPFFDQLSADARNRLRLDVQLSGVRKPDDVYAAFGMNADGTFKIAPPAPPPSTGSSSSSGGSRSSAASEAERQEKAIQNLIAGLEFERQLIGLSALDQEKLTNLRRADVDASSEQGQQIAYLTEQLYSERTAAQQMEDIWRAVGDAGRAAFEGIVDAMADGKIEGKELQAVLGSLAAQLGSFLLNMGMSGLGKSLKLPGYARGTSNAPGGWSRINEEGGEIVNLPSGSQVIPHDVSMELARVTAGHGAASPQFTFAPVIDARNADTAAVSRLEALLTRMQSEFEVRVKQIVKGRGKRWL